MNVSQEFIRNMTGSFYESLINKNLCKGASHEATNEYYKKPLYQKIYALRYLPAYYFEYCVLANELRSRLNKSNIKYTNILSLGCGLSPDYFAFSDNLNGIDFDYAGYDVVAWSTQKLMPKTSDNFIFHLEHIGNISSKKIKKFDVFVFPKSIGDIHNNDAEIINNLARKIAKTNKKRIYFLNSFVSTNHSRSQDISIFKKIHDALVEADFSTKDDIKKTYYRGQNKHQGLKGINYGFEYPENNIINCDLQGTKALCSTCNVVKSPIFTNQFMDYQILEYKKNDN